MPETAGSNQVEKYQVERRHRRRHLGIEQHPAGCIFGHHGLDTSGGQRRIGDASRVAAAGVGQRADARRRHDGDAVSGTDENTTSSATLVDNLLDSAGWTESDTSASKGIAVMSASGNGTWQYSTDGTNWQGFGTVSSANALLLTSTS